MSKQKILFVLTGHDRLGEKDQSNAEKTGFHLSEAAQPWQVLTEAGFDVELATPNGGKAPVDPSSYDLDDDVNRAFVDRFSSDKVFAELPALASIELRNYDAIYFPGGHGTMWDLPENEAVQRAIKSMYESGKPVGAVCHGPAALVNVKLSNGEYLVAGKTLSVFTDDEEKAVEKAEIMPFMLASTLEKRGASIDKAANFERAVSVDGNLVTGQNPASARGVGEALRDLIVEYAAKAA